MAMLSRASGSGSGSGNCSGNVSYAGILLGADTVLVMVGVVRGEGWLRAEVHTRGA